MTFLIKLLIALSIVCTCRAFHGQDKLAKQRQALNNRPIIGVMMQTTKGMPFAHFGPNYIAASYIKYLESSGARVVPIRNDLSEIETKKLFYSINGVLFPGGNIDLATSDYAKVGRTILKLAMESFEKGDVFPIWGSCLGHEFLAIFVANTHKILTHTDSQNITLTLKFTKGYRNSQLFRDIPEDLAKFLTDVPSTANFHRWSVTVTSFNKNKKMMDFYNILSTSVDRKGTEFVSTMEGKKYPFFSTQWHPEKNSFEWSLERNFSHVAKAIESAQFLANSFVNKARLSQHRFVSQEEENAALIYNYAPLYTGDTSGFEQCYIFKNSNSRRQLVRRKVQEEEVNIKDTLIYNHLL